MTSGRDIDTAPAGISSMGGSWPSRVGAARPAFKIADLASTSTTSAHAAPAIPDSATKPNIAALR